MMHTIVCNTDYIDPSIIIQQLVELKKLRNISFKANKITITVYANFTIVFEIESECVTITTLSFYVRFADGTSYLCREEYNRKIAALLEGGTLQMFKEEKYTTIDKEIADQLCAGITSSTVFDVGTYFIKNACRKYD